MEKRAVFARAWDYLNFKPGAKWLALAAGVGSAFLVAALLGVLGLFVDLIQYRGHIPALTDLSANAQQEFRKQWDKLEDGERSLVLRETGTDETTANPEQSYRAYLYYLLKTRVDGEAADLYQQRLRQNTANRGGFGLLSFVLRNQDRWTVGPLGWLAHTCPRLWQFGSAEHGNQIYLSILLGIAVVLALVRASLLYAMHSLAGVATIEAANRLRKAIYHHASRLGTLMIRPAGLTEAVSMFVRHVEAIQDSLYAWLTVIIREPIQIAVLVILALLVNFWLAIVLLALGTLAWLGYRTLATLLRDRQTRIVQEGAEQLALLQESLLLVRLVKSYLMDVFNQARVEKQLAAYSQSVAKRSKLQALAGPLLGFLALIGVCLLLYIWGLESLLGLIDASDAVVLLAALIGIGVSTFRGWHGWKRSLRGHESAVSLFKFLDRPADVGQVVGAELLPPMARQLEFDNVTLREPLSGKLVLQGISLTIPARQRIGIVGPDDMEKRALVYLIARFLDPTAGEVRIDEHNLRFVTLNSVRAQAGLVLQHNLVFNDSIKNNIGCGESRFSLPQVIEAAKLAHAHQFIQKLAKGYDTVIGDMGHALTIGEQFRIALARAILRDPPLYVIEEPASHYLNEDTRDLLDDTFNRILPGKTVVFLPRRISTLRSCGQVYFLHKGKIVAHGEHKDLVKDNDLYQHLYYVDFHPAGINL